MAVCLKDYDSMADFLLVVFQPFLYLRLRFLSQLSGIQPDVEEVLQE